MKIDRTIKLMAASGQIQGFKRRLPEWVLAGFVGWWLGILTCLYLISL